MSKATTLARTVSQGGFLQNGTLDQSDVTTALGFTPENTTNKNQNSGYAGLDNTGKVASQQLPSYVDDVLEYANQASLPASGESGKIYITLNNNKVYRWSGSVYVEIVATPGSTDSVAEGSTNLYYTNARARGAISVTGNGSYDSNTGVITVSGVNVGGSTTQVQYNSGGSLAGSANLVWDNTNVRLGIGTTSPGTYLEVASPSGSGSGQINIHSPGGGGIITKLISERAGPFRISAEGGSASGITFETGNSVTPVERMRLNTSGQLLLGTSSARAVATTNSAIFEIEAVNAVAASLVNNNNSSGSSALLVLGKSRGSSAGGTTIVQSGDELGEIRFAGADGVDLQSYAGSIRVEVDGTPGSDDMPGRMIFSTTADGAATSTERMRIDSYGNVGIGVTPSAWWSGARVNQIGQGGVIEGRTGSTVLSVGSNYFINSSVAYAYIGTGNASRYDQLVGEHRWHTAPSGTAGNSITFTQAMTLSASGSLGIGTSSPSEKLHMYGTNPRIYVQGDANSYYPEIRMDGVNGTMFLTTYFGIGITAANTTSNNAITFRTGGSIAAGAYGGSERMRIDGSGNVGIGTSSPGQKLDVHGTSGVALQVRAPTATNGPYLGLRVENALAKIYWTWDTIGAIPLSFEAGGTERMRVTSGGALSIGATSTSGSRLGVYDTSNSSLIYIDRATGATAPTTFPLHINATSGGSNTASYAGIRIVGANGIGNSASIALGMGIPATYGHHDTSYLQLYGGGLWQNNTYHWSNNGTDTYQGIAYDGCEFYNSRSDNQTAFTFNAASTSLTNQVLFVRGARTTTNSTFNLIFAQNGNGSGQFVVRDSGNCANTNNSYGAISDEKLKQDIVDASPQWNDIKNIRVRKFRWKSEVAENPNAKPYLGLIAQEAELVSPGLIESYKDYEEFEEDVVGDDGNVLLKEDGTPHKVRNRRELGTVTKTVKYSILYMKAIKALQEAMERIETLEAKIDAQAARIAALLQQQ